MNFENAFLEQGILGAMIIVLLGAVGLLFRANQTMQKEIRDTYIEMMGRYESVIISSISQQKELQSTLERLVEGVAAQELMTRFVEQVKSR